MTAEVSAVPSNKGYTFYPPGWSPVEGDEGEFLTISDLLGKGPDAKASKLEDAFVGKQLIDVKRNGYVIELYFSDKFMIGAFVGITVARGTVSREFDSEGIESVECLDGLLGRTVVGVNRDSENALELHFGEAYMIKILVDRSAVESYILQDNSVRDFAVF